MPPKQNRSVTASCTKTKKKKKRKSKNEKKTQVIRWVETKETHSQRSKIKPS